MKVAIVHDFLTKLGGAENVLKVIQKIYPDAPTYTLLYDEKGTKGQFKNCQIITSSLQKYPRIIRKPRFLFSKLPSAIEEFDLSDFDIVISSSNSYAHGVITPPKTFHASYCHSPMRYAWDWYHEYLSENNIGFGIKGLVIRSLIHKIRVWDRVAADRVDLWIANSSNVQKRIKKYYRQDSIVIYPPVDTTNIQLSSTQPEDFYLIVSRLEPYKNIRIAVDAFNLSNQKLVIIGEGSQREELEQAAKKNIHFLGWQSDESVHTYLAKAKALIFPGEDDFGITPVESMAAGRPVIAYKKGGVIETVIAGKTGVFFDNSSSSDLAHAIAELEKHYLDFVPSVCRTQALKFSTKNFEENLKKTIESGYDEYQKKMRLS